MAKIVYSDYKEDLKSPQKVSVNDESPDIEIDTRTKRFPRVRRKSTPYGQPNHFYSVHDYFNSINDSSPYRHVRQDEPNRSNDMIFCEDTIRNPNYDNVTFGEPIDDGGNFTSWKMGWFRDIVSNYDFRDAGADRYYGCAYCIAQNILHDGFRPAVAISPPPADLSSSQYGASLWNSMKPAKPTLGLGIVIGELRDIPRLLQARLNGIKTISDFYLAIKFGWEPLFNDIKDMLNFYEKVSKQIDFILNNIGKPIRRSAYITIPERDEVVYQSQNTTECWIDPTNGFRVFGGSPNYARYATKLTAKVQKRVWGSGEFIFYFDHSRIPERRELAAKLSGLQLTPSLVWELLPWSWLIDWFSNVGDILNNLVTEVADNQISTYAYSMMHTYREYTWWATDGYHNVSVSRFFESKVREKINPFGLATFTSALSPRQIAIMMALGISRS